MNKELEQKLKQIESEFERACLEDGGDLWVALLQAAQAGACFAFDHIATKLDKDVAFYDPGCEEGMALAADLARDWKDNFLKEQ